MSVLTEPEAAALAAQFEQVTARVGAEIAALSDEDWRTICMAERWSVGVTAFHIAEAYARSAGLIESAAGVGEEYLLTTECLNAMNDFAALAYAQGTRAECLALLGRNARYAAGVVRALTPAQLACAGVVTDSGSALTPRALIARDLLGHPAVHLESIRAAVQAR